jgi:hypothetical protein
MMWDTDFSRVDEEYVGQLIENGVMEHKHIEYKSELPGESPEAKKEFLQDATSLANSEGGFLFYGIAAKAGRPVEACGIDTEDTDAAILRLENMLRDGVTPRVPGVRCKALRVGGRYVVVMRVPRSWQSPHMVAHRSAQNTRFYSRSSNGKYALDVEELRSAFLMAESKFKRIEDFRNERLWRISDRVTEVPVERGPTSVLHMLPAAMTDPVFAINMQEFEDKSDVLNKILRYPCQHSHYCLNGYILYGGMNGDGEAGRYLQVFRSGALEFVRVYDAYDMLESKRLPGDSMERSLAEDLDLGLTFLHARGVPPPAFVSYALLGAAGLRFGHTRIHRSEDDPDPPFRRDTLVVADVREDDYSIGRLHAIQPILAALWNAAGYSYQRPRADEHDPTHGRLP